MSAGRGSRLQRLLIAGLGLVFCGIAIGCSEVASNVVEVYPYKVEPIKGTDVQRVTLDDPTAERIDLQTAKVRGNGKRKVIPHLSLIYSPDGDAFVYTKPKPQTYVRARVEVDRAEGDRVTLTDGPPAGTEVVTVGAAELLATEFEILNQHP